MMPINRKLTLAWLVLMALTLLSFTGADIFHFPHFALIGIFAIAAIKGLLVAHHFMEVGHALPHWKTLYLVWIVFIALMLAAGHML